MGVMDMNGLEGLTFQDIDDALNMFNDDDMQSGKGSDNEKEDDQNGNREHHNVDTNWTMESDILNVLTDMESSSTELRERGLSSPL